MVKSFICISFIFLSKCINCQTYTEYELNSYSGIVLKRGPYLQIGTSTSLIIRWSTETLTDSKVNYGTSLGNLNYSEVDTFLRNEHEVNLLNLIPNTKYYYSIGSSEFILQGDSTNFFKTAPPVGSEQKVRIWAAGDCGSHFDLQFNVRDAYENYIDTNCTDVWMLLGDNAYLTATELEYQNNFFDVYNNKMLKQSVLWPAPGNHEYANNTLLQNSHTIPYFEMFTLPTQGEAGGFPSGNEAYYSYDYANIHFISLDSYGNEENAFRLYDTLGPQSVWLKNDLALNTQKWTIVYFHHPPYTMGTHNSDSEIELVKIRQNLIRILERYKVDLVLCGHSHVYERSKLMKGHFGMENTFDKSIHNLSNSSAKFDGTDDSCPYVKNESTFYDGTVYVVSGSAGKLGVVSTLWPHDAMHFSDFTHGGSMAIEIEGNKLISKWVCADGVIRDEFTIVKNSNNTKYIVITKGETVTLKASWVGSHTWSTGETDTEITVTPMSDLDYFVGDSTNCYKDVFKIKVIDGVSFDVYPNPSLGKITIEFKSPIIENVSLDIFDMTGRLIKTMSSNFQNYGYYSFELDSTVEKLTGMYFFKLNYGDKFISEKVVLN